MSKLLILASLVLGCATAPASADPRPSPANDHCAPSGTPIFEIRQTVKSGAGPSSTQALYADGGYTSDASGADGKSTQHVVGVCVSDKQLADAKAALKDATWTVTVARIRCMARDNKLTTYLAGGKEVFSETLCDGKKLDDKSAAALATLKSVLGGPAAK
jgi:hypothetical protein